MPYKHVGIRPTYKLIGFNADLKLVHDSKYEIFPDGGWKLWTTRMLNSGCNHVTSGDERFRGLIYCERCDEFFSVNQFEEVE